MEEQEFVERLRRGLPRLLKEHPELRDELATILEEHLAPRKDLILILEEIRALREDFNKMLQRQDRFEEEMAKLREDFNKMLQRQDRFGEEMAKLREDFNKMLQRQDRFEERQDRFGEEMIKLREDFNRGFAQVNRRLDALGARWGLLTEEAFREGLRGLLEHRFRVKVERWKAIDSEGVVFGYKQEVEVDLAITDKEHILIEVKSSTSEGDILLLARKGDFYYSQTGVRPKLVVISPWISPRALAAATALGIEVHTSLEPFS